LYQYLGTGLTLNGHGTLAILDPIGPFKYRGIYRIPYALTAPTAQVEFDSVTASVSHDDLNRIGSWTFPINSIAPGGGVPVIVLDVAIGATDQQLSNPDFSQLATNGYRLTVTTRNESDAALMTIDVAINPSAAVPDATYTMVLDPHPPGLAIVLESVGNGVYDGELLIPSELVGTTTSLDLLELTSSDVAAVPISVGTWSLRLSKRPRADGRDRLEVHMDGRPIEIGEARILHDGFDLYVGQGVNHGNLYLQAVLQSRSSPQAPTADPGPVPTTR